MASKRKQTEVAKRQAMVAELYLQGRYQWDIAAELGVHVNTIVRDLQAIRDAWRQSAVRDYGELTGRELHRIDSIERECWAAWVASKVSREVTSTEKTSGGQDTRLKAAVRKESREGNPSFLAGVQWCVERRCKILGLDAPAKNGQHADALGTYQTAPRYDLSVLSDEQLEALERIRDALEAGGRAGTLPALPDADRPPALPDPERGG